MIASYVFNDEYVMAHWILLSASGWDEVCDPKFDEAEAWLQSNMKDSRYYIYNVAWYQTQYRFCYPDDAMLFKLAVS